MAKLPTRKTMFDLVGEGHDNPDGSSRQQELLSCEPGEKVLLRAEVDNPHDENAVSVLSVRGVCIGYLSRDDARSIRSALLEGRPHTATLHQLRGGFGDYPSYGARLSLTWDWKPAPPFVPLDAGQRRARVGKSAISGRQRDETGRLVAAHRPGCFGVALVIAVTGIATLVLAAPAVAASDPYFCSPTRKEICNYNKPCESVPPGDFLIILDEARNTYTRCDKPDPATCSTYSMVQSGDAKKYKTYEMPSRGGFSKIGPDGDWSEAVSLGGMIIVSHGMCLLNSELRR